MNPPSTFSPPVFPSPSATTAMCWGKHKDGDHHNLTSVACLYLVSVAIMTMMGPLLNVSGALQWHHHQPSLSRYKPILEINPSAKILENSKPSLGQTLHCPIGSIQQTHLHCLLKLSSILSSLDPHWITLFIPSSSSLSSSSSTSSSSSSLSASLSSHCHHHHRHCHHHHPHPLHRDITTIIVSEQSGGHTSCCLIECHSPNTIHMHHLPPQYTKSHSSVPPVQHMWGRGFW